jgi:hypothetical protein
MPGNGSSQILQTLGQMKAYLLAWANRIQEYMGYRTPPRHFSKVYEMREELLSRLQTAEPKSVFRTPTFDTTSEKSA